MRVYKIILTIIVIAIILGGGSLFYVRYLIFTPANAQGVEQEFIVEKGQSATQIAANLKDRSLIKSAFAFKFYAVWKRRIDNLQAGTFKISSAMNIAQILDILSGQSGQEDRFTIIEGERLIEIAKNLEEKNIGKYPDFMQAVSNESPLKGNFDFLSSVPKDASLEGFIFPDSYDFTKTMTAEEMVKETLNNFEEKTKDLREITFSAQNNMKWSELHLDFFQIITMASIIEREAANDEDRPKIASVYYNRLAKGMKLEADPTVQYAKGSWDPIRASDYHTTKSPYNTYLHKGLPPGPICSPGLPSIEAAVNPTKTDYLFFFHLEDGTTIFSKTKAEHDAAKAKYRLTGQR